MPSESLLFWLVLFGFLFFDNLVLINSSEDILRVSARGALSFKPTSRMEFSRKELLMFNPLNLLDRHVLTSSPTSSIVAEKYRQDTRRLRRFAHVVQPLVYLGYGYLLGLIGIMFMSFNMGFEAAVLPLLITHVFVWLLAFLLVLRIPPDLRVGSLRLMGLAFECLLVPAYIVNLNRILLRFHTVTIGAVPLGVREYQKCHDLDKSELLAYRLASRLSELKTKTDSPSELHEIESLEKCLRN